jgi:MFS family permease
MGPTPESPRVMSVQRATFYFALVYFSQGVSQVVCLLNQPLRMYLQDVAKLNSTGISKFLFVVGIPWIIKPVYGLLSDFVPIFGYRRKSYLLIMNMLAAGGFLLVMGVRSPQAVMIALTMTGVGVAASDVVVDAMMVQTGQQTGRTRLFQGAQWFSINVAAIISGLLGSAICHRFANDAVSALRTASLISMLLPFVVAILTWFLITDQRARINLPEFAATGRALLGAFKSVRLWLVVAFIFLVRFNPGLQTPMYDHLETKVGISHSYLALLDTSFSVGQVLGSVIFMVAMSKKLSLRRSMTIGLIVGALGVASLLLSTNKTTATIMFGVWGATDMIVTLSYLSIAAEACPKRVEAVVFAALMSVSNLSWSWADVVGSKLYDGPLQHQINPLIIGSAALTALGLLFLPLLKPAAADHGFPAFKQPQA